MSNKTETFENSLERLEEIVKTLEDGELPLEESLRLYEEGTKLSRECIERLNQAEQRIEMLGRDTQGNPVVKGITEGDTTAEESRVGRKGELETED